MSVSALAENSCSSEREGGACDSCEAERDHGQVLGDLRVLGDCELCWEDWGEKEKGNGSESHCRRGRIRQDCAGSLSLQKGRQWEHCVTLRV